MIGEFGAMLADKAKGLPRQEFRLNNAEDRRILRDAGLPANAVPRDCCCQSSKTAPSKITKRSRMRGPGCLPLWDNRGTDGQGVRRGPARSHAEFRGQLRRTKGRLPIRTTFVFVSLCSGRDSAICRRTGQSSAGFNCCFKAGLHLRKAALCCASSFSSPDLFSRSTDNFVCSRSPLLVQSEDAATREFPPERTRVLCHVLQWEPFD